MTGKISQIIPPDAYPQMVPKAQAAKFTSVLRSRESAMRAAKAITAESAKLRDVVRGYVDELERSAADPEQLRALAHEIRGLAETAGLAATGRIAEGLCRYLDQMDEHRLPAEAAVAMLHISAIARAARAEDEATRMSEVVAAELAALVNRKLTEAKAGAA
jgi:hypothetical protein